MKDTDDLDDNSLEFPTPSHPEDELVYRGCMVVTRLLNKRLKGLFTFDREGYEYVLTIHRLSQEAGYKSPVTAEQLLELQSDFS